MATARTKKETVTGSVKPVTTSTRATSQVKVDATPVEDIAKEKPVKEVRVFTDSDYILCRSVTYGGLYVCGQSGNAYEFKDYGSECEINYRDLVSLIRKGSDHVFLPRFIILDDDLLNEFPTIKKAYETAYTRKDLLEILALPISQMKAAIAELPEATQDVLEKMIGEEIANGNLDSIAKVCALSNLFDSDFNLLSDLFVR